MDQSNTQKRTRTCSLTAPAQQTCQPRASTGAGAHWAPSTQQVPGSPAELAAREPPSQHSLNN